jgi:hypothetical protein
MQLNATPIEEVLSFSNNDVQWQGLKFGSINHLLKNTLQIKYHMDEMIYYL